MVLTRESQKALKPGYYWIKRREPDGPPFWQIGDFNGEYWLTCGSPYKINPTVNPLASNHWEIKPTPIEPPL